MNAPIVPTRRRHYAADPPVELRFVDMLLIVIATLMFVAILLSVISAFQGNGSTTVSPRIMTTSAPAAIVDQSYDLALAVQGGDGRYTWQIAHGALPQGLTLDVNGFIRGTPEKTQSTQVGVQVTDGSGRSSEVRELALTVRPSGLGSVTPPPPRIVAPVTLINDAVAGQEFSHAFKTDIGTPPYRWTSSPLPAGLQLTPDGTLAGQPQNAGTSMFTVTVQDSTGASTQQQVQLEVRNPPQSWFWRVLGWIRNAITYYGYFLVALGFLFWLIGHPGSGPRQGVLSRIFGRR